MLHYINAIVEPYVDSLRAEFQKPRLVVYFIMDKHGAHRNANVLSLMKERRVEPIWLRARSIHFLQALDTAVFGSFKSLYSSLRTKFTKPKLEGMLLRLLHAWHDAINSA
jgi:hypothetical protein